MLLAGLAAVLDFSGRRRTVMDDRRRRPGTELRRELRLEPNDACPPNGSGNGHRRRSERWRWDLNPREGYPSTRFRVLRIGVQSRLPVSAPCSTSPPAAFAEPSRTTTNETKTETTTVAVGSIRTHVRRPTVRILGGRHCPAGAGKNEPEGYALASAANALFASGATALTVCGSSISGSLTVAGSTGPVSIGGSACANQISGSVSISNNTRGVTYTYNTSSGSVTITNNGGGFTYSHDKATGTVTLNNNT